MKEPRPMTPEEIDYARELTDEVGECTAGDGHLVDFEVYEGCILCGAEL